MDVEKEYRLLHSSYQYVAVHDYLLNKDGDQLNEAVKTGLSLRCCWYS